MAATPTPYYWHRGGVAHGATLFRPTPPKKLLDLNQRQHHRTRPEADCQFSRRQRRGVKNGIQRRHINDGELRDDCQSNSQ